MKSIIEKRIIDRLTQFKKDVEAGVDISKKYVIHRYELPSNGNGFNAKAVKKLRKELGADLVRFAGFLGVTLETVKAWENGSRFPNRLASRFLEEIREQPDLFRARFQRIAAAG